MLKKEKKQNENENKIKNNNNFENNSYLEYIKIDNKNKLEGLKEEEENNMLMEFANSISVDKEDNIGKEINNFFIQIIPENKDGDILKVNYALSKKIEENYGPNKKQMNKQHEEYMTQIMNSKINQNFSLTSDINEKLSFILSIIFKKIKKINKINKWEDLETYIKDNSQNLAGILEKYKDKNKNNNNLVSSYVYIESPSNIYNDYNIDILDQSNNNNIFSNNNSLSTSTSRISKVINNINEFNKNAYMDNNKNTIYIFREIKTKKQFYVPLEVFVLREKFEKIKKLKLQLKKNCNNNDNNDILLLDQKDILNNIFILLNLKLLFPYLFEIELDITNENILKDLILSNNDKYEKILKKSKKCKKTTNYKNNFTKRIYDLNKKSIFNEQNKNNNNILDETELSESYSIISSVKDNKDEEIKKQEYFIKKYMSSLEMLIIYWYFLSKIDTIKTCDFTIPINLEDKIILMLKEKKILLFEFCLLNNLFSDKIIDATLDFNSLDNKLFQQILNFLFKNDKMKNCRLSFFPPEEYFESQFLLNLLFNSSNNNDIYDLNDIKSNEDIEAFILKKLYENFEQNIKYFFCFFINKPSLNELSLIFDIPYILKKIDCYELIIIKLIINMFIYLDKSDLALAKNELNNFTIIADNIIFDNRKYPFLNIFFDNINLYRKKKLLIKKLTLKIKMIEITNIYRLIPYNINYLSLGSFDLETFEYFVEYITSIEFNTHSELISLQITLGNSIIFIDQCFDLLLRLLVDHPRNLEEICLYTNLNADYYSIKKLLEKINFNKIEKIFIQFSKKSLDDNNFKKKYGDKFEKLKDTRDNNFIDLYFVKNNEKNKDKILRMMFKIGKRYNKNFMDYNIFLGIEKFISKNEKKKIIIQYN